MNTQISFCPIKNVDIRRINGQPKVVSFRLRVYFQHILNNQVFLFVCFLVLLMCFGFDLHRQISSQ